MHNLLRDPIVRATARDGVKSFALPELYAALFADEVESFPALRPHQRHAWHALLCQLAALVCIRSGLPAAPADASGWREALRRLTPGFPDEEPWWLVSPLDKPAFLQPVVGVVDGFKHLTTPDALDILVTSKNHDVKAARLDRSEPDDWLFALATLQTMEGFLGAGNYGISRMNGGFSNRPGLSLAPVGGVGAHVRRDAERLIELHEKLLDDEDLFDENGLALVWLVPWDGATSLRPAELDPYYIEICRRVRLMAENGRIHACASGSKAARIDFGKEAKGLTGDPWTPIETSDGDSKALTIDARGFSYRRMSDILSCKGFAPSPLQLPASNGERDKPMVLVARALARGKGKTEGLHERRIPASRKIVSLLADGRIDEIEVPAKSRVDQAGFVRKALRFGLMTLFQNGPDDFRPKDPNADKRAGPFLEQFETEIDKDFFDALFREVEADSESLKFSVRKAWLLALRECAFDLLKAAEAGSPMSAIRRHRAMVRAESAFQHSFYKSFANPYFPKETAHDAS